MNVANRDYQEKRNFIRMKVDTPAKVVVLSEGEQLEGICRDLSGGGMSVELNTTLPVGTEVEISIESGHGHNPMLQAKAIVTRVIASPDTEAHPCLLGLEISALAE